MTFQASAFLRARAGMAVAVLALVPLASSCGDSPAQVLAKFCSAADGGVATPAITADDDATAVKQKISDMADGLKKIAGKAPDAVKDDVELVSTTAKDIASALSESSSLNDVVKAMQSLSTKSVDAASVRINKFVTTNCKASS